MMLHLHPDRVRLDRIEAFPSQATAMARDHKHLSATGRVRYGWLTQDLNPQGAVGDATLADAGKGRLLVDHAARGLVDLVGDMARFPLDQIEAGRPA
jgi:creatinine amidohydrolase